MLQELDQQLNTKHVLKHPFYQAWTAGDLTLDHLRTYACQYFHQVEAFPRYLSATHSNCLAIGHRQVLLANLQDEEEGPGNHPALWLKFTKGLGLSEAIVRNTTLLPETQQFIDAFLTCARTAYAEGIGALYAYERQIPQVAASKIKGLKQHYGITDEETIQFFTVHLSADVEHTKATRRLMNDLSAADRVRAGQAAKKIAQALWDLLSAIQAKTIGTQYCSTMVH